MKKQLGLTLLELLSSLSIFSFLCLSAAPSLKTLLIQSEAKSTAALIRRSAAAARHHALISEQRVTLCGIDNNQRCRRDRLQQLLVFFDENSNHEVDSGEKIIHAFDLDSDNAISLRASFRRSYIQFNEDGSASQAGSFIYCARDTPTANRRVTISMSGRAYHGRDRNGDGIVELTNGQPISC